MAFYLEHKGPGGFDGAFGHFVFRNRRSVDPVDPATFQVRRLLLLCSDSLRLVEVPDTTAPAATVDDGAGRFPSASPPVVHSPAAKRRRK